MTKREAITKTAAVQKALHELGDDAPRSQLQKFIKEQFGHVMSADHISNCKSALKKKRHINNTKSAATQPVVMKPAAPAPKKPDAAKPATQNTMAPKPHLQRATARVQTAHGTAGANGLARGISLHDIGAVKDLVGRVGAGQLKGLIDLLKA